MDSIGEPDLLVRREKTYGDWRDDFFDKGYAIIKNAITPERAEYYRQKQVEWLQSFNRGFNPNDENTWTQEHLPVSFKGGMYFAYCSTHEKWVWEARMEPGVMKPFRELWGTDELLVSFDGMNVTLPRQKDLTWSPWPHCGRQFELPLLKETLTITIDQDPNRKGLQCAQGLLNYAPNGPEDGGLILMEGSAKLYDQFFKETRQQAAHEDAPPPEEDFKDLFIFKEEDVKWFEDRGCRLIKTNLDVGDLVIWDSRQMHYACHPQGSQIRHVQYICFTPAKFAKLEDLKLKADMFKQWGGTTHWPHCNIHPHRKAMRDGEIDPQERDEPLEKPVLTDRLLQLAAVKAY